MKTLEERLAIAKSVPAFLPWPDREAIKKVVIDLPPGNALCIGVFFGADLLTIAAYGKHFVVGIDLFDPQTDFYPQCPKHTEEGFASIQDYIYNKARQMELDNIILVATDSRDYQESVPLRLLVIDGLHTYAGCKSDLRFAKFVLRGGVIMVHDYNDNPDFAGVKKSVTEFLAENPNWELLTLSAGTTYAILERKV